MQVAADAIPRCTYRVQLSRDFPFARAAECADYLAELGVSHLYCSPILQAAPDSTHGYDVVDPTRVSAELGGEDGLRALAAAMRSRGIGLVIDIVPNHMATSGRANPWWWDILKHGRSSRYAEYFDIDWEPAMSPIKGKVLLGVLDDRYGRVLESGRLSVGLEDGETVVLYGGQAFPLTPGSTAGVDLSTVGQDHDALDALLQRQHYRLAYWRTAQEELNYRRFFTVDTLIGLRVELDQVFADSHRLILELVAGGTVAGLRVDHVDGLRDPVGYLQALRRGTPGAYIAVEKILAVDEQLPDSFPVDGTTGYDFLAHADGLAVETESGATMTALYHAFTGEPQPYPDVVRTSKLEVMASELAPDVERLTSLLATVCEGYRSHRDRTRRELIDALRELVAALPVYRTYSRPGAPLEEAGAVPLAAAVGEAARRRPDVDGELLRFIADLVLLRYPGAAEAEFSARFQQLTPAVMAKGVEDTAFFRYGALTTLNEVGDDPGVFGRSAGSFHSHCGRVAACRPSTMLTLSTHDTKRSADVRARIAVLSQIPGEWEVAVRRWSEHNDRYRSQGYPDRGLEYLTYQTLVGAWPIEEERLVAFLRKSAREAKVHTSWVDPVAAYEDAMTQFVRSVLVDAEFRADLETFIGRNQVVSLGRTTSLAWHALMLTAPGIPDIYQGNEEWDLSLLDPDNRRPVDFDARHAVLREVASMDAGAVMGRADDGAPKLWLIARCLGLRARRPELFASAVYKPLEVAGARARHAIAFSRGALAVVAPTLVAGVAAGWGDTTVTLPDGAWADALTGATRDGGKPLELASVLERFPVSVLVS
jgi:(1->4)-alpha-D-glucan 1-alpha-D-glucosylmutase